MKSTIVIFLLTVPFAQERTVRGVMQARPGADAEDVEVKVHPVPVDPPSVAGGRCRDSQRRSALLHRSG